MYFNLAPGAVGIRDVDLTGQIDLARRHGFGGIDAPLDLIASMSDPDQATVWMQAAKLRWGGFGLPCNFRADHSTFQQGLSDLRRLAPLARRIGCLRCYTWIMPGHDHLDYRANFRFHVERLTPLALVLAEHQIGLGLEFVGPRTLREKMAHEFVHTIDQILELCDAVNLAAGTANVGVLLDSFHWYTSRGAVADITGKLSGGRIVYVHVNDAAAGRGPDEQIDNQRALPCQTGVIDLAGFLDALRQVGYDGPLTCEPFMEEFSRLSAEQVAARVMKAMGRMASRAL